MSMSSFWKVGSDSSFLEGAKSQSVRDSRLGKDIQWLSLNHYKQVSPLKK